MKIKLAQSILNKSLNTVFRIISPKPTHPILSNILIVGSQEENIIRFTAYNLSEQITISQECKISEDFSITVPAKRFTDIVSKLPSEELSLELKETKSKNNEDSSGLQILIKSKSGKYLIPAIDSNEFPAISEMEECTEIKLPAQIFKESVESCLFSAATDETKQVLRGLNLFISGGDLNIAATDGHRLAVSRQNLDCELTINCTIPAAAMKEATRLIEQEEDLVCKIDKYQCCLQWSNILFVSRILEGDYPQYDALIPKLFSGTATLDRNRLIKSLSRVEIFASTIDKCVEVNLKHNQMIVAVKTSDIGNGSEVLEVQYMGEDIDFVFNISYLMEGLKHISTNEVDMNFNNNLAPVIFNPVGGENYTYLSMPIQKR